MTNKSTKRALISSVLALVLCFTMLLGTTFAWFTDSATSKGNLIQTGNLDVELYQYDDAGTLAKITNTSAPAFGTDIIWEPGMTVTKYFAVKNEGSIEAKIKIALEVYDVTNDLNEVMQYTITKNATPDAPVANWTTGNSVAIGNNETGCENVALGTTDADNTFYFAVSVHMDENAGNTYQLSQIKFDINVLAGQNHEFANYPETGFAAPIPEGGTAAEILVTNKDGYKVGSFIVPKDASAGEATGFKGYIGESSYNANITVAAGLETTAFEVKIDGIKADNTTPIKVQLRIAPGLDPATVSLYHYDDEIDCIYNPSTGYVTFETATFSPFTVVYDAESVYVAPEIDGMTRPTAKVTYKAEYVNNSDIAWGNYGQWSPTEGLDANLEAAFEFACPELSEEVYNAFANWYCDFYVSLDKNLGADQIFLGGNYGSFGWVGFHNGTVTLEANEELGLLESVTTNPWTYADVANYVGVFTCGVGDVGNALEGATFTVKLRLTNPEDATEYYDVNVVTYTFGGSYTGVNA